jgi:hypothetical protein
MTNPEKLLLFALESCRPEQVDDMLEMARDENVPLTEVAVEVVRSVLDGFSSAQRFTPPGNLRRWESIWRKFSTLKTDGKQRLPDRAPRWIRHRTTMEQAADNRGAAIQRTEIVR